jgi:hypothetical protein
MTIPDPTDRIIAQGRALVRAIEALGTIQPTGAGDSVLDWLPGEATESIVHPWLYYPRTPRRSTSAAKV